MRKLTHRLGAWLWGHWILFANGALELVRETALQALKIYLVGAFVVGGTLGTVATVQEVREPEQENVFQTIGRGLDDLLTELRGLRQDVQTGIESIPGE